VLDIEQVVTRNKGPENEVKVSPLARLDQFDGAVLTSGNKSGETMQPEKGSLDQLKAEKLANSLGGEEGAVLTSGGKSGTTMQPKTGSLAKPKQDLRSGLEAAAQNSIGGSHIPSKAPDTGRGVS